MRRLVTSLSAQTRLRVAEEFLSASGESEILFVTPTWMAAADVVRSHSLRRNGMAGVHRFSLPSLAFEMASSFLAEQNLSVVSGIAADAVAARATDACRSAGRLKWFEPVASTPGFFRSLASTISELRLNNVDLAKLANAGPAGTDLAQLTHEFVRALNEARVADLAGIYDTAQRMRGRFHGMSFLMADVRVKAVAERRFIQSLIASSPSILATTHPEDVQTIAALEALMQVKAEAIPEDRTDALGRLRRSVFSIENREIGGFDSSVDFRSSTDESRETVEIARAVLSESRKGIPFDGIAVLLRSPDVYQPLIEDAFRRAGIPSFYTQGSRRPNPSGRAFLTLLACASEGLPASRFAEYLSLGQVPGTEQKEMPVWMPMQGELFSEAPQKATQGDPFSDHLRAPQSWERLLVDAAVIGGVDRWERRLTGLDREFEKQIAEVHAESENRLRYLQRQRSRLNDLREFALPLIKRLADLPASTTWGEWLDCLEELAHAALRQPEAVLTALAELRPMAPVGPVRVDEVREVLTHRLTFLRIEPTDRRYGKVFVGTISEAAGMSFQIVFLPGLGEDIFPQRSFEDPLLLDEMRQRVDVNLTVQDIRIQEERLLFHIAAGVAERKLCISYPRLNLVQGRARGPSFYALEVMRGVIGRVPGLQELRQKTAEVSETLTGWPAPRNPETAIDDAEYDVAVVSQLLRVPIDEARARGRYLVSVNSSLARSLRNRAGRWRRRWTEGDGIVDPDAAALAVLAQHRPGARPYSATALQQFAACPYRFLLYAIHRLEAREEPAPLERMDALTRGSLFHSIQFRFLTELRSQNLLPLTPAKQTEAFEVADSIIQAVAREYREELAPAILRIWEAEVEDIRWDVRGWIREMMQNRNGITWTPRWFELSFGLLAGRECDPASIRDPIDIPAGLHLRGSIDMIEEGNSQIRVTDHKTGKAPTVPPGLTGRGEILQPLLYAEAAELLLGKPAGVSRLFYCTERGGYRVIDVPITAESRSALDGVVRAIDDALVTGFLPAAPRERACLWCDYKVVCGPYEEMRTRQKPKERLAGLMDIRQ